MALIKKVNNTLSSNDKVMHYLQNSTNNTLTTFEKPSSSSSSNNLFFIQQHRSRSCSENDSLSSSSSSVIESIARSDLSTESSLSDPVAFCSFISSNISSDEDLDFNIGFEQISDDAYFENRHNADAITLHDETNFDEHIDDIEEYLRQPSNSTIYNDNTSLDNHMKQRRASFLYDSTFTLCSPERFSGYMDDDAENNERLTSFALRSNSLSEFQIHDNKTKFIEKAPKKVVRFADMMGLDLESIRYMTPPDQTTTTSILQECLRLQLGQLRLTKNYLDIPNFSSKRSSSSSSLPSPTKQYNLVSKNFISPINIIPLIYNKQVLLECLYTKNSTAYGTIRVHNISFEKRVFIRLTYDEWKTSHDIEARHSMNYSHDNTDTFTFEISLSKIIDDIIIEPKRILFAICLQTMSNIFWDNNQEWNYVLDVYEKR